jgi:hypothetical protein
MPGDPLDPFVESRIDAALRSYAEPPAMASDPRTAAAAILERARQSRRRRSWWLWGIPVGAAAAALVIVLVWSLRPPSAPNLARTAVPLPESASPHAMPPRTAPSPLRSVRQPAHRLRSHAAPLPEQAVFPTPAPLSHQEQALVVFTRVAPPAVRKAVIDEQIRFDPDAQRDAPPIHPIAQPDNERP